MRTHISRMALIDALKGGASQLIVLHHLAFYGPMSDVASELAPDLIHWFSDYARIAVQAFLVMSGFLAARTLAPMGVLLSDRPLALIGRRYFSLVLPFVAALLLAMLGSAVARSLVDHDSIPAAPALGQLIAHAALLHSVLDVDSLSAGVWYVAIDFQLFILLAALLFWARKLGGRFGHADRFGVMLVAAMGVASLLYFNRVAAWDVWGFYFFGAYGLGVFAYWVSQQRRATLWLGLMFMAGVFALLLEYRLRIAVALSVAMLLAVAARGSLMAWPQWRLALWLGKISYSVFLVHFPVCLVVNAVFHRFDPESPAVNLLGMGVAWMLSIAAGALFHAQVERRVRGLHWPLPALPQRWVFTVLTASLGVGLVVKPVL